MGSVNLFEGSQYKEEIALIILKEMEELLNVSFIPFFPSEKFATNIEEKSFLNLDYNEEQFRTGLSILAKFHAASEAYNRSKSKMYNLCEIEILKVNPFCQENLMKIFSLIIRYLEGVKEMYPNTFLDDISLQDIEVKFNTIKEKLKKVDDCKKLLINGHFSRHNLIFNVTNTYCLMKDFSYVAYQSPLFDVFQYVSSFSSKANWNINSKKAKVLYYEFLHKEMQNYKIDLNTVFSREEYEETFGLVLPSMKIIFFLGMSYEKNFFELSEILNILNLELDKGSNSVISFEDCYLVFQKLKMEQLPFNAFRTIPQEGRNGFLGEHHDMIIELGKEGKQTIKKFFLKGIPHSKALQEFERTVGSFFKETMFYSRYVPLLKEYEIDLMDKVLPECYFANEYKYIVLDNLKTDGFTTLSPRSEMNNEVITEVIKNLAKLNASCIILEELIERKTAYKYRLSDHFEKELKEAFYSSETVIESHRNSGAKGMTALTEIINFDDEMDYFTFRKLAEEACDEQVFFAQPSDKWRNTLCHGDFWTKNFMIKFEEDQVKNVMMIDFQTYRYAPPAQDLMAFIYLNTTAETRQKYMNNWLNFYYENFSKHLQIYSIDINNILPRKDFDESCKFYKQFAITQSITHFQIILIPPQIIDPLLQNETRAREIFLGSRYELVKMVWQMDEVYRRRLTENVGELRRCLMTKMK